LYQGLGFIAAFIIQAYMVVVGHILENVHCCIGVDTNKL
jgi:hypothetical protein